MSHFPFLPSKRYQINLIQAKLNILNLQFSYKSNLSFYLFFAFFTHDRLY